MKFLHSTALSFQHVFVMYMGAVIIPIIVGRALNLSAQDITILISADLLTSGIATLLYSLNTKWVGVGLPVVLGASFNSLSAFITIGGQYGLPTVYGSVIISGLFIFIFAPWVGRFIQKLPTIITGVIITMIGLSLIPIAFQNIVDTHVTNPFLSHMHTLIFLGTLLFIFIFNQVFRGFFKNISIMLGVVIFSILYYQFNPLPQENLLHAFSAFYIPQVFHFGFPQFHIGPILTFIIIMLITSVESAGDLTVLSEICQKDLTSNKLTKSFRAEGIATCLGGIFNAFTYSNFAENVSLVQLTGVKKVSVIQGTAAILILLSFCPFIAALTLLIPTPVLGGTMLTMFGMIATNGIRILSRTNFEDEKSIWTLTVGLGFGVGIANIKDIADYVPSLLAPILSNPIVMSSGTALITYYTITWIKRYKQA